MTRPRYLSLLSLGLWGATGCYTARPLPVSDWLENSSHSHASAGAQPSLAVSASSAVNVEEAVKLSLANNPELRALRESLSAADGEVSAASALKNPTLDVAVLHAQTLGVSQPAWFVELGWEPPQPLVLIAERAAAKANVRAVDAQARELEWLLRTQVQAAHATLLALEVERNTLEKTLVAHRRLESLTRERVTGGSGTKVEVSLLQLELAKAEQELDELESKKLEAAREFSALLGTDQLLWAQGELPERPEEPASLYSLAKLAQAQRPLLEDALARYEEKEQTLRAENARRWPWFKFTAAPRYRFDDTNSQTQDVRIGIQLTLPILDFNSGPVQVAAAERKVQEEEVRGAVHAMLRDLQAAREEVLARRAALERFRKTALPALEAHEQLMAATVKSSALDATSLLKMEEAAFKTRQEYARLRLLLELAWLKLDRAVGPPPTP